MYITNKGEIAYSNWIHLLQKDLNIKLYTNYKIIMRKSNHPAIRRPIKRIYSAVRYIIILILKYIIEILRYKIVLGCSRPDRSYPL